MDNLYYNPKKVRKIKHRRSGRTLRIWGWILTALGGIVVLEDLSMLFSGNSPSDLFAGLMFLIPGVILLWHRKRQVDRWDRYEALVNQKGNTSISMLAQRLGLPEKRVYTDLQKMINNDFFIGPNYNIEAYINGEHKMLVMTRGGHPLEPLPEKAEEETAKAGRAQDPFREGSGEGNWHDYDDDTDIDVKAEPAIQVELTDLEFLQESTAKINDENVRNSLYGLEGSLRRIDERIQKDPELKKKSSIRNLYRYYLPQIMELVRSYRSGGLSPESREQIGKALSTSAEAMGNIEADLMEADQMDLEVNIEVLKNMFTRDGLLRSRETEMETPKAQPGGQDQPARQQVQQRR